MKGGTAINLFVQDMPRLSVDIDVVYLPWQTPRDEALQAINQELAAIAARVAPLGVQTRLVRAKDLGDTKLIVENEVGPEIGRTEWRAKAWRYVYISRVGVSLKKKKQQY